MDGGKEKKGVHLSDFPAVLVSENYLHYHAEYDQNTPEYQGLVVLFEILDIIFIFHIVLSLSAEAAQVRLYYGKSNQKRGMQICVAAHQVLFLYSLPRIRI